MMLEFSKPFPVYVVPFDMEGYALYVTSAGMFENDCWLVALDDGRLLHFTTNQLRYVGNGSYDMKKPRPLQHEAISGENGDFCQRKKAESEAIDPKPTPLERPRPEAQDIGCEYTPDGCWAKGWDWSKRINGCPTDIIKSELAKRGEGPDATAQVGPVYPLQHATARALIELIESGRVVAACDFVRQLAGVNPRANGSNEPSSMSPTQPTSNRPLAP